MGEKILKKVRKSNFELLRILAMFLIVLFHGFTHINVSSSLNPEYDTFSSNQLICFIFGSWGSLGVGLFFLISAHFTVGHSKFNAKKIFKLILMTIFWSLVLGLLFEHSGIMQITKATIKGVLAPFLGSYWFITAYILLYIISPFLDIY